MARACPVVASVSALVRASVKHLGKRRLAKRSGRAGRRATAAGSFVAASLSFDRLLLTGSFPPLLQADDAPLVAPPGVQLPLTFRDLARQPRRIAHLGRVLLSLVALFSVKACLHGSDECLQKWRHVRVRRVG